MSYCPPARKLKPWQVAGISRELSENKAAQLRAYGCDPATQVLMLDCSMPGMLPDREWRALGATYAHREALKRAGMKWDKRGFWSCWWNALGRSALDGVPCVWREVGQ